MNTFKPDEFKPDELSSRTLLGRLESGSAPLIIDSTPEDRFRQRHLPQSRNACVYQVTFLQQVQALCTGKDTEIVICGAGGGSLDALAAADKLHREGYRRVSVLRGGLEGWAAEGLPLEGEALQDPGDPQALLPALQEGRYRVDGERSGIEWRGRNAGTTHHGHVRIAAGEIDVTQGIGSGHFRIAMDTIESLNLRGDPLQPVLEAHLKSDDFFFTQLFPTAVFHVLAAVPAAEPFLSRPNLHVSGLLEIRGVKAPLEFTATAGPAAAGGLAAEAHFDLDRTRWGVRYGSSRFYRHLGMHLVFDLISIQLRVTLLPAG
jgi:polyisoprenoid-binding protein YceI